MRWLLVLAALLGFAAPAAAQTNVIVNCYQGPTIPIWTPCSPVVPFQVSGSTKSSTYASAGNGQYGLAVPTATGLTVPTGATIAEICVETAGVRYKDDGGTPTSSSGIPVSSGSCFQYAGPLAALLFIAQSGSPTLDVSYYK